MIKTGCINPLIISTLSRCMHGDKVLITTGNFRFNKSTKAAIIYVGIKPNLPTTLDVALALKDTINIEKIELRSLPQKTPTQTKLIKCFPDVPFTYLEQEEFHRTADAEDIALIIVTGGTEYASNILITINM